MKCMSSVIHGSLMPEMCLVASRMSNQRACLPPTSSMDALNANRTLPPQSSAKSAAQADQKARGANRSTKVAGKLKVLPDQPDVATQSQILSEPPKPAPPPTSASTGTPGSDDEDAEDEDEPEEPEEQDVEVCCAPPICGFGN